MLNEEQKSEIKAIVDDALDRVERVWSKHGSHFAANSAAVIVEKREVVPSRIPAHPLVDGDRPKVDKFIALVADIRDSSNHLLCAIKEPARVSMLQRVYYETSALLPALERTISYENGQVTEYLGDGILALFSVDDDDKDGSIYKAFYAARHCLVDARNIVNNALRTRYHLPAIDMGIGLSLSDALVSLVGIDGARHPKVIGRCVWQASKLAGGRNEIYVDSVLDNMWPVSKEGKLNFTRKRVRGYDGFLVSRAEKD